MNPFHRGSNGRDSPIYMQGKAGSEPVSKDNISMKSRPYPNLNMVAHSQSNQDNSSNYLTMRNVSNNASNSFRTINQPSNLPITHNPLKLESNTIRQFTQPSIPQNSSIKPSQFHPSNSFTEHNYKFEYLEMKSSYERLIETQNRLMMDYDIVKQQLKVARNNEEYLARKNAELSLENGELKGRLFALSQELAATRLHKEELFAQVRSLTQNGATLHSPNAQTPNSLQQPLTLNPNQDITQLQHQNQQLLYRIQQYQTSILYKNMEIQKYKTQTEHLKIQIEAKQVEIMTTRRQLEMHTRMQAFYSQSQKEKATLFKQTETIPALKSQIEKLTRDNYLLTDQIQSLIKANQQLSFTQKQSKQTEAELAEIKKINQAIHQNLHKIQNNNNPPNPSPPIHSPQIPSQVLTTYIGQDIKNYQKNDSFNKINQGIYKSLSQNTPPVQQRTSMKIQDEAFYDFGKQTEDFYPQPNTSLNPEKPISSSFLSKDREINSGKERSLTKYRHNQFQLIPNRDRTIDFGEGSSENILSFPQLPFRSSKAGGAKHVSFIQTDEMIGSYQQGRHVRKYQQERCVRKQNNGLNDLNLSGKAEKDYINLSGKAEKDHWPRKTGLKGATNELFQHKILDLLEQNKRLKINLLNQRS